MAPLPATFRAYEYAAFGDCEKVVTLNAATPQQPLGPTQVRLRVVSAATDPADLVLLEMAAFASQLLPASPSPTHPLRVGCDVAGTIVEIGDDVTRLHVDDEVYACATFEAMGAFGEYLVLESDLVAVKPKALTFNEAAGVPMAAGTSYQALVNHGKVQPRERVLILGASGGTGVFAVQIAKALGADVVATTSFRNVELVKSLGADQVIDYTKDEWGSVLPPHSIDVIYDCGVDSSSWNDRAQVVLKRDIGRFVTIGVLLNAIESPIGATWCRVFGESNWTYLEALNKLVNAGKLIVPIDSVFPFEHLIDALARQKTKRAKGKIIVEVAPPPSIAE